jgi:hypothetical protein
MQRCRLAIFAALALGCSSEEPKTSTLVAPEPAAEPAVMVGVSPTDFQCDSVAPLADLAAIIGSSARSLESAFAAPQGVPEPCNYAVSGDPPVQWSFDLDCRESALDDAAKLMVTYAESPSATPVRVGESGLDHNNVSLLFIDDNTPCYVRVLGPTAPERLAIATLIAERLTEKTAPTGEHIAGH